MAVTIKNIEIKASPVWLQAELVRWGSKPINNIVDVTNYIMLLTAQPMHAYDYDKVGGKLGVRMAQDGEQITLLSGKTVELNSADIVITDGEKAIGLAGVMGGSDTEVSTETKNIILECANFDMYTIRRTSMRHGLFTDAVTRFTKGQSPLQNPNVLNLAMMSVHDVAGGEQASEVVDDHHLQTFNDSLMYGPELIGKDFINERLGLSLSFDEIAGLLRNVEFTITNDDVNDNQDVIDYTAPFWRTDIEIPEDIVEEVGRLYGFDKLPHELPRRTLAPAPVSPRQALKTKLRNVLSRAGANEVLTYSFVHRNLLERSGQNVEDTYQLSNALSPDLHYLRRTILPSLLDKVHPNVKTGYSNFAIFEIGKGHKISAGRDEQDVPLEQSYVSLALAGGDFYQAKAITEFMAQKLGVRFVYEALEQGKLFEPKRSALIRVGDQVIGAVGEFRAAIRKNFKLPDASAGFEIDFDVLLRVLNDTHEPYRPLSRFPSAERDITLQVPADTPFGDIKHVVDESLASSDVDTVVTPLGIYRPEASETKNVTLRLRLTSHDKTLTGDEVTAVVERVIDAANDKLDARVV